MNDPQPVANPHCHLEQSMLLGCKSTFMVVVRQHKARIRYLSATHLWQQRRIKQKKTCFWRMSSCFEAVSDMPR